MNSSTMESDIFSLLGDTGTDIFLVTVAILFFIYILSSSVIFGLYVYVFQCNEKRDKKLPMYPILQHFYKTVIHMQIVVYFGVVIIFILSYTKIRISVLLIIVYGVEFVVIYFLSVIINSVHNILIFALAVRAFLIFLYPGSRNNVVTRATFQYLLKYLYYFVIFSNILLRIWKFYCWSSVNIFNDEEMNELSQEEIEMKHQIAYDAAVEASDTIFTNSYIFSDLLVLASSFVYLFMFLKARKVSGLANSMSTKPEKFIFYQTIIIIFAKILVVPLIIVNYFVSTEAFVIIVVSDMVTTPFVIQISYLICNQSGLETLSSLPIFRLKELIAVAWGQSTIVVPS